MKAPPRTTLMAAAAVVCAALFAAWTAGVVRSDKGSDGNTRSRTQPSFAQGSSPIADQSESGARGGPGSDSTAAASSSQDRQPSQDRRAVDRTTVGTGELSPGARYKLEAWTDDGTSDCIHMTIEVTGGRTWSDGCDYTLPLDYFEMSANSKRAAAGPVIATAARVVVELRDGTTVEAVIHRPPEFDHSFYVANIPNKAQVAGAIALNSSGSEVGRHGAPQGDLSTVVDPEL